MISSWKHSQRSESALSCDNARCHVSTYYLAFTVTTLAVHPILSSATRIERISFLNNQYTTCFAQGPATSTFQPPPAWTIPSCTDDCRLFSSMNSVRYAHTRPYLRSNCTRPTQKDRRRLRMGESGLSGSLPGAGLFGWGLRPPDQRGKSREVKVMLAQEDQDNRAVE